VSRNIGKLRKAHDGLIAGSGTDWSFYEEYETYEDIKVDMKIPYDYMSTKQRKLLHGPVKTYHISELKEGNEDV